VSRVRIKRERVSGRPDSASSEEAEDLSEEEKLTMVQQEDDLHMIGSDASDSDLDDEDQPRSSLEDSSGEAGTEADEETDNESLNEQKRRFIEDCDGTDEEDEENDEDMANETSEEHVSYIEEEKETVDEESEWTSICITGASRDCPRCDPR
jgi:hypothetical protein